MAGKRRQREETGPSIADGDPIANRVRWSSQIPGVLFSLIRSGLSPQGDDPTAWYDRVIRVVGGVLILLGLGLGAVLAWIDLFKRQSQ
jgi:hypothetical protein